MTGKKSVAWSVSVNLGNNESLGLMVTDEVDDKDDAREVFAFGIGQLIGVANGADEKTARVLRDFVARFVQEEEARPAAQDETAPTVKVETTPAKEPWTPTITKSSYGLAQAAKAAKQDAVPDAPPTIEDQAKAAVAQCVKPPTPAPQPTPSAPPTPEASASTAPPAPTTAPDGEVCGICGASVTKSQAKLSQLFMSKTMCKGCFDKQGGV